MLWDCTYCGTAKLLGLTHRHCPACGAPQDPTRRYYPSDADKIAVHNHRFAGADLVCPGCQTPNAAVSGFCVGCGMPLQGAKAAIGRVDQVVGQGQQFQAETVGAAKAEARVRREAMVGGARAPVKKEGMSTGLKVGLILGGVAVVVGVLLFIFVFWKKEVGLTADAHSWERAIAVEQFKEVTESDWCDRMPRTARKLGETKAVRETRRIQDGETCKTRRKDNRDGTFKQVKECTPKYREEPVYDRKCRYKIDKWTRVREATASGKALDPEPSWPDPKLKKKGTCKGCERTGNKRESYTVHFVDNASGEPHDCAFDQAKWAAVELGSEWKARVGIVTDSLDCDSLVPR
jgi:hypothetical protein